MLAPVHVPADGNTQALGSADSLCPCSSGTADHRCLPSVIQEVRDPSADFPLDAVLVELVDQETMINLTEGLSKVHNEDVCLLSMC